MGASLLGSGIAVPRAAESFVRPEPLAEFGFAPRDATDRGQAIEMIRRQAR
jgi:hypothetical protein